ncbi:MAG: MBL fold metallo-hydrolase [Elusimicrobiota bacterium]|jgi:7,8-dihydropterin-6-yl-methyl-4-(beta-D-ribofuranosyl)aminobenzene 5'-phosphate synthase|nr:MBL fold metallo-hydrolase [Elusimicrobiota bacterium]
MKLTVLVDNNTIIDRYFLAEPALSFYIEDCGKKILFDAGYSDVFIKNAEKLNIDLCNLDFVILSHGHSDHTRGLEYLIDIYKKKKHSKPALIAHPRIFHKKEFKGENIGIKTKSGVLKKYFNISLSASPVKLTKNLNFLGEIPRTNSFETSSIGGDALTDDTALVYQTQKGLTIITGCSHSGICNISEHAKKLFKNKKIDKIIGGLHLLAPRDNLLAKTVNYLVKQKLTKLYPCHCVDLKSKVALTKKIITEEIGSGSILKF